MTADERRMLHELWANQRLYPPRLQVGWPLSLHGSSHDQSITFDAPLEFIAELTSSAAETSTPGTGEVDLDKVAYTWQERIQSQKGVWSNGPRSGTLNAYRAEPSSGIRGTLPGGTMVTMRECRTTPGVYEFIEWMLAANNVSDRIYRINIGGTPTAGSFTLEITNPDATTTNTGAIAYNATFSTVLANITAQLNLVLGTAYVETGGDSWSTIYVRMGDSAHTLTNINVGSLTGAGSSSVSLQASRTVQWPVPTQLLRADNRTGIKILNDATLSLFPASLLQTGTITPAFQELTGDKYWFNSSLTVIDSLKGLDVDDGHLGYIQATSVISGGSGLLIDEGVPGWKVVASQSKPEKTALRIRASVPTIDIPTINPIKTFVCSGGDVTVTLAKGVSYYDVGDFIAVMGTIPEGNTASAEIDTNHIGTFEITAVDDTAGTISWTSTGPDFSRDLPSPAWVELITELGANVNLMSLGYGVNGGDGTPGNPKYLGGQLVLGDKDGSDETASVKVTHIGSWSTTGGISCDTLTVATTLTISAATSVVITGVGPAINFGAGGINFANGLLTAWTPSAAIADLAGGATLADVITTVNTLLAACRDKGIIDP